jgi:hypothetical protein
VVEKEVYRCKLYAKLAKAPVILYARIVMVPDTVVG